MRRRAFLTAGLALASAPAAAATSGASPGGEFQVAGRSLLRAYQGLVEEHLGGLLRALRGLARTSDARSGDWDRLEPVLQELASVSGTYATLWYVKPDGAYFSQATGAASGLSISDRAYFSELMAGHDVEGDLAIGKATGRHAVVVATPVIDGGKPTGAVGASVDARMLSDLVVNATQPPPNLTFYAVNEHGQNTIHKDPKQMAQFPSEFGTPSMKAAVARMLTQTSGVEAYDYQGGRRTALFNWSPATRWRFVLAHISPIRSK